MNVHVVTTLAVLLGFAGVANAAESCDSILANGINNIAISKGADAAVATKYFNYCEQNFDSMSDNMTIQAEVEIFGYGGGSGNFNRNQSQTHIKDWCKTNKEYAESHKSSYNESRIISDSAVAAWTKCKEFLRNQEVEISPLISANLDSATITLKYRGTSQAGVRLSPIQVKHWSCSVDDPEKPESGDPTYIKIQAVTVACQRIDFDGNYERDGQRYEYWPSGNIQFAAGNQALGLDFEAIYKPSLPDAAAKRLTDQIAVLERKLLPVGAVVAFYVSPEEVETLSPEWVPADGRVINDHSSPMFGQALPDLRNRFVLGSDFTQDIKMSGETTTGGSNEITTTIHAGGSTGYEIISRINTATHDNTNGPFLVDTNGLELQRGTHVHDFTVDAPFTVAIMPPYRKLLYFVRVR